MIEILGRNKLWIFYFRKYKSSVNFIPCNLTNQQEIETFCDRVTIVYPEGVDILINNAGRIYNSLYVSIICFEVILEFFVSINYAIVSLLPDLCVEEGLDSQHELTDQPGPIKYSFTFSYIHIFL